MDLILTVARAIWIVLKKPQHHQIKQDTGDNQYLLRVVRKTAPNQYELHAQNPAYQTMLATNSMKTFARLKAVLESQD